MNKNQSNSKIVMALSRLAAEDGFIASNSGSIRWTAEGLSKMRRRFAAIGIDIRSLTNVSRYLHAREQLSDNLGQEIRNIARSGKWTTERELLVSILKGDEERSRQLELILSNRGNRKRTT